MIWHLIHLLVTLLWDSLRFSRLSPDDKTIELLLLRQQLLILRRRQKRGPTITRSEKLVLMTLVEQLHRFADLQKAQLEQVILIFKPDTLLRWHRELVRRKWTFNNQPKQGGRPPAEPHLIELVLQLARDNRWGDDRITGVYESSRSAPKRRYGHRGLCAGWSGYLRGQRCKGSEVVRQKAG